MMNIIRSSWMYEYSMIAPDKVLCQLRKNIVTIPPVKSPVFIDTTSKPRIITLGYDPIYKRISRAAGSSPPGSSLSRGAPSSSRLSGNRGVLSQIITIIVNDFHWDRSEPASEV